MRPASQKDIEEMQSKPYSLMKKTVPLQLELFQFLGDDDKDQHSNSVAYHALLPRFVWNSGKIKREASVNGNFLSLPTITRQCQMSGIDYEVTIRPARLKRADGVEVDYYPGEREQIIEMAALRLAIKKQRMQVVDKKFAGVTFKLNELREELKSIKHTFSLAEIKQAIEVGAGCLITTTREGDVLVASPMFPVMGINQKQPDGSCITFLMFDPILIASIEKMEFRQLDYVLSTSFKSYIARHIHFRMAHNFTQAALTHAYSFWASTIIRDAAVPHTRLRDALGAVREGIQELKDKGVIMGGEKPSRTKAGSRANAIVDEFYDLMPSPDFVREQKRSNAIAWQLERRAQGAIAASHERQEEATKRRLR